MKERLKPGVTEFIETNITIIRLNASRYLWTEAAAQCSYAMGGIDAMMFCGILTERQSQSAKDRVNAAFAHPVKP